MFLIFSKQNNLKFNDFIHRIITVVVNPMERSVLSRINLLDIAKFDFSLEFSGDFENFVITKVTQVVS